MADDTYLDVGPADDSDALDPDLAGRFRLLESLTPPDTWPRATDAPTVTALRHDEHSERPWWLLVAAAGVVVAGIAALQLGSSDTASIDVADAPTTMGTAPEVTVDGETPTIEPPGRPPVKSTSEDGLMIADLQLEDGSRFRVSLPERLGSDLRFVESAFVEPIRLSGTDVDIAITFGSCPDEDGMTMNAQGSAASLGGEVALVCRADEVLSTTFTSGIELTDADLDAFDVRPIAVAGAYQAALTEVWPDLANCGNCARWGPTVYPGENIVVSRSGSTSVTAVRLDTLTTVWTTDTGGFDTYLHGGPSLVHLEVTGGPFLALDPATGDEIWRIERDPDERDLGLSVHGDDRALIRTSFTVEGDGRSPLVRWVDLETGGVSWTSEGRPETSWQPTDPVVVDGRALLVDVADTERSTGAPSQVLAFDLDSGETLWTTDVSDTASASGSDVLVGLDVEDGLAVLVRSMNDVARIDPSTGSVRWRVEAQQPRFAGTDLSAEGRLAIDLSTASGRRLLDPVTGADQIPVDEAGAPTCPVTMPADVGFVPPEPWPAAPTADEFAWYGTDDLWTVIDRSGHVPRKGVWWSANFPGGAEEEQPQLHVTYRRLGSDAPTIVFAAPGTNAYTVQDGDFMINGIEPDDPGCWLATATYKGATLSYIYEVG